MTPVSTCCGAPMRIGGNGKEGTHYLICKKCNQACDVKTKKGK